MDLERIATSAIKSELAKTDVLSAFINDGDKEPCWDGNIYIHEDSKRTKKNIKKIAAQVKGKAVKSKKTKDSINYKIDYDDLYAYMMNGGTLFFVVYIDSNSGNPLQIYYASLLPIRIKGILKNKQKSYSVTFKKFPSNNTNKLGVIIDAYSDSQRQASYAGKNLPSIDELSESGALESLTFHVTSYGNPNFSESLIPQLMEGKPLTIYANVKGNPIGIPVEHHDEISHVMTSREIDREITVNGIKYYDSYTIIATSTNVKILIGKCLSITSPHMNNSDGPVPITINIDIKGTLSEQIRGFEFVIALSETDYFEIDKSKIPVALSTSDFSLKIQRFRERLALFKSIQDLLAGMHIKKDLDLTAFSEEDDKILNLLIGTIGKKLPVKNVPEDVNNIHPLKVSNVSVAIMYLKHTDGLYYIHDYFSDLCDMYAIIDEEEVQVSQYAGLDCDDFFKYDNLHLPSIIQDIKRLPLNLHALNHANFLMLEVIKAYDKSGNKEFLDLASEINEWLAQHPDLFDEQITFINECQINYRLKRLSFPAKARLYSIATTTEEKNYRLGAYILLDSVEEVKEVMDTFSEEQLKTFKEYPIYTIYENGI